MEHNITLNHTSLHTLHKMFTIRSIIIALLQFHTFKSPISLYVDLYIFYITLRVHAFQKENRTV